MTAIYPEKVNLKVIETYLEDLENEENYQKIIDIFNKINMSLDIDSAFFDRYKFAAVLFFTKAFPRIFDFIISRKNYQQLFFWLSIFVRMCNFMALSHLFIFIKYLPTLFDLIHSIPPNDYFIYSISFQVQSLIKFINKDCDHNIYSKYLIDQFVQIQIPNVRIIPMLINDFPFHQSFSEISEYFSIFNHIFPYVIKSVLEEYELEFSRFQYSIDDQRFNNPESINLTKAMVTCSPKYASLHFDNLLKFMKKDNPKAKEEFVSLLKNSENLKYISEKIERNFDFILTKMRDEKQYLNEISSIILSNDIVSSEIFYQKAGFDLAFNLAFFDFGKERYTKEAVSKIIDSEPFCSQTVEFGFKIIDHKIDLMPNVSTFIRESLLSSYFKEDMMNTIICLSKSESNRQILLDSINNYEIHNQTEYEIILQILILLKPSETEFNYDDFINEILNYTDSVFILPFLTNNDFIPVHSIDIELLVSYSIFNKEFSEFLFSHFADSLANFRDFFLTFSVEDDENEPNSRSIYGRFLFDLFKLNNSEDSRLLWESVIRLEDKDEEVHQFAQKIINENPTKSQTEIIEKVGGGYAQYFINFDFSGFSEVSSEENGNFLVFNKPKMISEDSFFYYASKVRYLLNHCQPIEEQDVLELFEVRSNDSAIDSIILNTIFDATKKMSIMFPFVEESLSLSLEVSHKGFIEKLVNYIIESEGEVIVFNNFLLNSILNFDENLFIQLIQSQKVPLDLLYNYFGCYQTKQASDVMSKLSFNIPIQLLNRIVYSKQNFIDFIESNRVNSNDVLPFIYSYNFPQFYRTKRVISSVFNWVRSSPILLLNFLKNHNWDELNQQSKSSSLSKSFIPYVKSTKYYHAYLAFARVISHFVGFGNSKISDFLSNIIYSREGQEDSNLLSPINEVKNNLQSLRSDKEQPPEYLIDCFVDKIMSKLPNSILKEFEMFYIIRKTRNSSNYVINHELSMKIRKKSISKEIESFCFLNNPKILLFNIRQRKDFYIDKKLTINGQTYLLSSIVTNSKLFVPRKVLKKSLDGELFEGFTRWSNGEKEHVQSIEEDPLFIFYRLKENDEEFERMKNQFKKIRSANYVFNYRAILCDSLNEADIKWEEWKQDETLFEIASILLREVGYSEVFKKLSTNSKFSEFFFTSNWEEKYLIQDINEELINLAQLFPSKDDLLMVLFKAVQEKNRRHFASIILSSFELNREFIEKLIKIISPSFNVFEDALLNYFMKPTTTNEFLIQNEKLAEFVLTEIEKKSSQNSFQQIQHLLTPLTDNLFIICLKCLSKSSIDSLLKVASKSTSRILLAMTELPHTDDLSLIYCQTKPVSCSIIDSDDEEAKKKSNIDEFRKDLKWIQFCLASKNKKIRNHTYSIFKYIFNKADSDLLTIPFEETIVSSLFMPYFSEVKDFIETVSGVQFKKRPEFTLKIYNQLFGRGYLHSNQIKIAKYISELPACPNSMIPQWKLQIDQSEGEFFIVMGKELLVASIRSCYEPSPNYFVNIISKLVLTHDYYSIEMIMTFFAYLVNDENVHNYIRMIIEFEKWIPYYIHFIHNIMINCKEFRESQLIMLAIVLPNQVFSQKAIFETGFDGFNSNNEVFISALDIAIKALELVLDKKALIRINKEVESDELTSRLYYHLIEKYFQVGLNAVFQNYLNSNQRTFEPVQQYRIHTCKLYLKFMTLCSIVFPTCLKLSLKFFDVNCGLTLFDTAFQSLQTDWSDFCTEVARQILADIKFCTIENKKMAVRGINRELCTQLFHHNNAEKSFLRFLIGVIKNDQLRTETKLRCNPQIFNVFRNNFVMYIDDVALFIDVSLQKYPEFFNDIEIKKFISGLQINDHQIIQKLNVVLNLLQNREDKMKELMDDVFPQIEQLANCEEEVDVELADLVNAVFEQALVIYSSD